jgi:hypothetical protein
MLKAIIEAIKREKAPLSLEGLSERLDVDRSALEGMLDYLVQKGIISDLQGTYAPPAQGCQGFSCKDCPASGKCPFIMQQPRSFTIVEKD